MLCYLGLLVSSYFTPPHPAPTLSPVHGRACHWGCLCCKALNSVTSLPGPSVHYSEYPMVLAIVRAFSGYKAPVFHWEGYWASFLCLDSQRNSPISVFCYPSFFFFLLTFIILRFTGGDWNQACPYKQWRCYLGSLCPSSHCSYQVATLHWKGSAEVMPRKSCGRVCCRGLYSCHWETKLREDHPGKVSISGPISVPKKFTK